MKSLERIEAHGELLSGEHANLYRALAARANYLAQDRPDLSFSCKELCKHVSAQSLHNVAKLKRSIRYVVLPPQLVWSFHVQDGASNLRCFVNTDFAGCLNTRRSTCG